MATQLAPLSACVTRILSVTGFPKELRTKDINAAFSDWDNVQGGFKIKWVDDTSLYVVFNDPTVAKRAYLQSICKPPAVFTSPPSSSASSPSSTGSSSTAKYNGTKIRPYGGPDAEAIIKSADKRSKGDGQGHTRAHSSRASISVGGGMGGVHARMGSFSTGSFRNGNGNGNGNGHGGQGKHEVIQEISIPNSTSASQGVHAFKERDREPSPTLPNLPQQPTLNALISSSLSPDHLAGNAGDPLSSTPPSNAPIHTSHPMSGRDAAPRIGNPGRRMVAHSLGVKHPGLSRSYSGDELSSRMKELQRGAEGMAITE